MEFNLVNIKDIILNSLIQANNLDNNLNMPNQFSNQSQKLIVCQIIQWNGVTRIHILEQQELHVINVEEILQLLTGSIIVIHVSQICVKIVVDQE